MPAISRVPLLPLRATYDNVANEWVYHAGVIDADVTGNEENNSMVFSAELNVQGVPLDTNTSEPFVMGGKLWEDNSRLYEVSNVLKNMDVNVDGYFCIAQQRACVRITPCY